MKDESKQLFQDRGFLRPSSFILHPSGARIRQDCPRRPGVYGMVDARGEVIYVGKAKSLRARLMSYFRPRSRDPKAGRILEAARRIAWELLPREFAALL